MPWGSSTYACLGLCTRTTIPDAAVSPCGSSSTQSWPSDGHQHKCHRTEWVAGTRTLALRSAVETSAGQSSFPLPPSPPPGPTIRGRRSEPSVRAGSYRGSTSYSTLQRAMNEVPKIRCDFGLLTTPSRRWANRGSDRNQHPVSCCIKAQARSEHEPTPNPCPKTSRTVPNHTVGSPVCVHTNPTMSWRKGKTLRLLKGLNRSTRRESDHRKRARWRLKILRLAPHPVYKDNRAGSGMQRGLILAGSQGQGWLPEGQGQRGLGSPLPRQSTERKPHVLPPRYPRGAGPRYPRWAGGQEPYSPRTAARSLPDPTPHISALSACYSPRRSIHAPPPRAAPPHVLR